MRIGIITIFSVPNYGAILQAYALVKALSRLGHEATVINYRQPALEDVYRIRPGFPPPLRNWLRKRRCDTFIETRIPQTDLRVTSLRDLKEILPQFDAIITGSDQVWFTGAVQFYDPIFFLDWSDSQSPRKISYAPSVGGNKSFEPFQERVRNALKSFHRISVRDSHSLSLVSPLSESPVYETIDPTFLHNFSEILPSIAPIDEPYLLLFGNFTESEQSHIVRLAKSRGLQTIVTLQYPCRAANRRVASPSPVEWLNWIKHSTFFVTSYFHGTAFAINFEREFLAIPTPGRRLKVRTLLETFALEDRQSDGTKAFPKGEHKTDWHSVRLRLATCRLQATSYLSEALQ